MEQEIDPSLLETHITLNKWPSVQPTALPTTGMTFHVLASSIISPTCLEWCGRLPAPS